MTIEQVQLTAEEWADFWKYFKGQPQQKEAIEMLRQFVNEADPTLLTQSTSWVEKFRSNPPKPVTTNSLPVPYLHQQDMASDGWRKCFTTTAAMIAEYLGAEPRGVAGERAYDTVRANYGDTTVAESQLAGLRHLGLNAHYGTDGTQQRVIDLLDQGNPVGLGMLHHGSTAHPTGGHWILAIGHTPTHCIVHDPYGEQDLAAGTWVQQGSGGEAVAYSWANLLPRWMPGGSGGWYLWATK